MCGKDKMWSRKRERRLHSAVGTCNRQGRLFMMFHDTQAGKFTQAEMVGSGWLWMAHAPVRKSLPAAAAWAVHHRCLCR
jgi:hypothetical protein